MCCILQRKVNEYKVAAEIIRALNRAITRSCGLSWVVGGALVIMGVGLVTSREPAPLRITQVEPRARPPRRSSRRQLNMALDGLDVSGLHLNTTASTATAFV